MEIFDCEITEVKHIKDDVFEYRLKMPKELSWKAGAHIHVGLPNFRSEEYRNKELVRHLSIFSLPSDGYLSFLTRIPEMGSIFKNTLRNLKEGDEVSLFKMSSILSLSEKPMVFLSMGVGIATFLPMLREWKRLGSKENITFLNTGNELFKEEVDNILSDNGNAVWVSGREAYFNSLDKILDDDRLLKDAMFYVVGSDAFLKENITRLRKSDISDCRILLDRKEEKKKAFFV